MVLRRALVVGLVAGLGVAGFVATKRTGRTVEQRRLDDRRDVTKAFADPLSIWLDKGVSEADGLVAAVDRVPTGAGGALFAFGEKPHPFGREALVVDRGLRRLAGSPRLFDSGGGILPCRDQRGAVLDNGLQQLAQAALASRDKVVRAFDDPTCRPVVAVAVAGASGAVAVVLADRQDALVRLEAAAKLANANAYLINGGSAVSETVADAPAVVKQFWMQSTPGARKVADEVVSWAPVRPDWGLVIVQQSSAFAGGRSQDVSNLAPAAVAAAFAFVLVVLALVDVQRRRALRRADDDRAEFLAIVGHELRTPLTVMKGFIETLAGRWDKLTEEQRQSVVERLLPQARRLNRVVDRLLTAADIQVGAVVPAVEEPVGVEEALERVADQFGPLAPLHRFQVVAEPGVTAMADRKVLDRVLEQLVDNAVKFSPSGGTVRLGARRNKRRVEITVEDEGVGLPAKGHKIFEAFVQGEDVDNRVHAEGGVGVGLFIVRSLLVDIGGDVRAEPRSPEPGARLVVTLRSGRLTDRDPDRLARAARVHSPN
jgi:signal transduction histidine kinase